MVLASGRPLPLEHRDAALLALIVLEGPVDRDRVLSLFWTDSNRPSAQNNLRQRLFRLRRNAGCEVVLSAEHLSLAPMVEHDLGPEDSGHYGLLGDLSFNVEDALHGWVEATRAQRCQRRIEKLGADASRHEMEGRLVEAIALAVRLTQLDPVNEHAHRRLMRLHYRRGDRAAAMQAYRNCMTSLDRILATLPSAESQALAATIKGHGSLPGRGALPPPVTLIRPPRLVGRQADWNAWEAAWQAGRMIVIFGEPGIGKSRLLGDFCDALGNARVSRAHAGDARMPYATWARWLRDWHRRFGPAREPWIDAELARLVPEIAAKTDAAFAPLRFRHACIDALAGWFDRGLAHVVIDDLQFADEASLETLLAWCAQSPRQRIAMALRLDDVHPSFNEWLKGQNGRNSVLEWRLHPLDANAVAELIESLDLPELTGPERTAELALSTGGNPFFLIEMLRAHRSNTMGLPPGETLGAPVRAPDHLKRLLADRLACLPADALRLARIAGLAGGDFNAEVAAATLCVKPIDLTDAWATLEHTQVFRDGCFAHDLMRESAVASVPAALARTLHGALARVLTTAGAEPARVAHHALEAGDWAAAAPQLEAAATTAFAAVRRREVVRFCDLARDCYDKLGDARAAFRVAHRAVESALHFEAAPALEARSLALLQTAADESEQMSASMVRANYLGAVYRLSESIEPAERALALAQRLRNDDAELEAAGLLGTILCSQGRDADSVELTRALAMRFDSIPESLARCEFASNYANVLAYGGRVTEAVKWCERAVDCGEKLGRADDLAVAWGNLAQMRWMLGCTEEAVAAGRRSLALHTRYDDSSGVPPQYAKLTLAKCLRRASGWEEAEHLLQDALVGARSECPSLLSMIENDLSTLYCELGQYARSRQAFSTNPATTGSLLRRAVIESRLDAQAGDVRSVDRLVTLMTQHRDGESLQTFDRLHTRLGTASVTPAKPAITTCLAVWMEAEPLGAKSICIAAAARLSSAKAKIGEHGEALKWARLALVDAGSFAAFDMDAPEFAWHLYQGLSNDAPDEALSLIRSALDKVRVGMSQVPASYRDAYWSRSPFVPKLRALAARAL